MPHTLDEIPIGLPGLRAKARKIRELVEAAKRKPEFRARAAAIVASVPQKDNEGEIRAVFDFVRDHVRYLRDPWSPQGLELFVAPERMLSDIDEHQGAGDCDDHVILASALLETIGYRTRYRIGGLPPDRYRHIWLEVEHPKQGWIPLELTGKDLPFGCDPSPRFPLTLTLYGDEVNEPQGLGRGWSASTSRVRHPMQVRMARQARGTARMREQIGDDTAEPNSFWNEKVANGSAPTWWGATPSDLIDAMAIREMQPEVLFGAGLLSDYGYSDDRDVLGGGGLFKKLGKKLKKTTKKVTKLALKPLKMGAKLGKKTLKAVKKGGKLVMSPFKKSSPGATQVSPEQEAQDAGIAPPLVLTSDATSDAASVAPGGYANPQPAYTGGNGAGPSDEYLTTPEQPYYNDPVPAEDGSYVPTPDGWPGDEAAEAFPDESYGGGDSDPGFGQAGASGDIFNDQDAPDPMDNTFGSLGAESWLSAVGKQAAETVLKYQQARLEKKAADKGYNLQFNASGNANLPPPPPPPRSNIMGQYGGLILGGVGLVVVMSLMGGVRRRR